jgi:hypothetical protein
VANHAFTVPGRLIAAAQQTRDWHVRSSVQSQRHWQYHVCIRMTLPSKHGDDTRCTGRIERIPVHRAGVVHRISTAQNRAVTNQLSLTLRVPRYPTLPHGNANPDFAHPESVLT